MGVLFGGMEKTLPERPVVPCKTPGSGIQRRVLGRANHPTEQTVPALRALDGSPRQQLSHRLWRLGHHDWGKPENDLWEWDSRERLVDFAPGRNQGWHSIRGACMPRSSRQRRQAEGHGFGVDPSRRAVFGPLLHHSGWNGYPFPLSTQGTREVWEIDETSYALPGCAAPAQPLPRFESRLWHTTQPREDLRLRRNRHPTSSPSMISGSGMQDLDPGRRRCPAPARSDAGLPTTRSGNP